MAQVFSTCANSPNSASLFVLCCILKRTSEKHLRDIVLQIPIASFFDLYFNNPKTLIVTTPFYNAQHGMCRIFITFGFKFRKGFMIAENLERIRKEIPDHVTLVAVSKTKPVSDIQEAMAAGQVVFGENKAQELITKAEILPEKVQWHMIGHLQTNKVKYIAPFVTLIHSADSLKVLKTINKEAGKNERMINCLLQIHIAKEQSKYGFSADEVSQVLTSEAFKSLEHVNITGVMGMATFTDDAAQVRGEFKMLKTLFEHLKETYFADNDTFREISMGMSNDYKIAIEEGSTMVRIGSDIFGERNYH